MTTDPIEVVRHALMQGSWLTSEHADKALAALETVRSNYLPLELLPEGYSFISCDYSFTTKDYSVWIDNFSTNAGIRRAGTTPNAAFLAAIKQIGDV